MQLICRWEELVFVLIWKLTGTWTVQVQLAEQLVSTLMFGDGEPEFGWSAATGRSPTAVELNPLPLHHYTRNNTMCVAVFVSSAALCSLLAISSVESLLMSSGVRLPLSDHHYTHTHTHTHTTHTHTHTHTHTKVSGAQREQGKQILLNQTVNSFTQINISVQRQTINDQFNHLTWD